MISLLLSKQWTTKTLIRRRCPAPLLFAYEACHEKTYLRRFATQVRLKPACTSSEASYRLEISDTEPRDIILSRQWMIKTLIRLRGRAGWSASLLFAYGKNRFSHDGAHIASDTFSNETVKSKWCPLVKIRFLFSMFVKNRLSMDSRLTVLPKRVQM